MVGKERTCSGRGRRETQRSRPAVRRLPINRPHTIYSIYRQVTELCATHREIQSVQYENCLPSVLWRCWLGGRKGIRPRKKTEWWGADMVICQQRGADLHMAQRIPLPLTVSCFGKIQTGYTFLVPAHLGSPGQPAVKRVRVCVQYEKCKKTSSRSQNAWEYIQAHVRTCVLKLNAAQAEGPPHSLASIMQTPAPSIGSAEA